ncbi:MAG: hypothetical protein L0Y38_09345 [Methylococcaceae bacterium]|nr:hypothetical protein [Methylococcaceae bacterium]
MGIHDFVGASQAIEQISKLFFNCELRNYVVRLYRAGIALGMQDEALAKDQLSLALAAGAGHGFENTLSEHFIHPTTARICGFALKHGIEPGYVKRIIHAQRLAPPSQDIDDWPWPIRIRAFGSFALEIEERSITFMSACLRSTMWPKMSTGV